MNVKADSEVEESISKNESNSSSSQIAEEEILPDEWMIRCCDDYYDEYKDCTSLKSRFNQYFIYGESQDCTQWRRDYDNCWRYRENNDLKSRNEIIRSETARREARLKAHYDNDVWKDRKEPPADWNKPLPEWLVKREEMSYLAVKSKKLKGEPTNVIDPDDNRFCTIM